MDHENLKNWHTMIERIIPLEICFLTHKKKAQNSLVP